MMTGSRAIFVISWAQTEADGYQPAQPALMTNGVTWRWSGDAMRVDAARDILVLEDALGMAQIRQRASRIALRLTGIGEAGLRRAAPGCAGGTGRRQTSASRGGQTLLDDGWQTDRSFAVTDGVTCWTAAVVQGRDDLAPTDPAGWLLVFEGAVPPRGRDLWLVRSQFNMGAQTGPAAVICFVTGTKILTPGGPVPAEALRPGDRVMTRDNGAQEVIWTGRHHISGARLYAMPQLRPVRICDGALGTAAFRTGGARKAASRMTASRITASGMTASGMAGSGIAAAAAGVSGIGAGRPEGDLLVSPDHRILLQGAAANALFGTDEVLVRAGDLIDDRGIRTDLALREVTYHHILLERHEVLFANGVGADSFHPGEADLTRMDESDSARLDAVLPGIAQDPGAYGTYARRGLTRAEAAILLHDLRH